DALKDGAIATGTATGETALGELTLTRLGRGGTTVLVATLPDGASANADAAEDAVVAQERPAQEREGVLPTPNPPSLETDDDILEPATPLSPESPAETPPSEPRPLLT